MHFFPFVPQIGYYAFPFNFQTDHNTLGLQQMLASDIVEDIKSDPETVGRSMDLACSASPYKLFGSVSAVLLLQQAAATKRTPK